jgi:hypothetical protein
MITNNFTETETSVTLEDLRNLEEILNIKLPTEFIFHYIQFNGGVPDRYIFSHKGERFVINDFLPIKYGKNTIEHTYDSIKHYLPKQMVPFAADPSGNYFCFSTSDTSQGKIYYWDHENSDNPQRAITLLADNLTQFIQNMHPDE